MSDAAQLRDLADRRDNEALTYRYCRAADRIAPALGKSIFHQRMIRDLDTIAEMTLMTGDVTARRDRDCPSYAVLHPGI